MNALALLDTAQKAITDCYSLEVTAKDLCALQEAAPMLAPSTPMFISFLPNEAAEARVAVAVAVRRLGFEPMPHFSARRIVSETAFEDYLHQVVQHAGVTRCLVVAGDPATAIGPYLDTMSLLQTGAFERAGVKEIGIAGHPDGHPVMSTDQCWAVLGAKVREIEARGMAALIVTQFGFDGTAVLAWLSELRARGLDTPVRVGIPGPAGIRTLLRFAARCGVGASAAVMKKYGISITNLLGSAGPDTLVSNIAHGLGPENGDVRLHFYPFGGLAKTAEWINAYRQKFAEVAIYDLRHQAEQCSSTPSFSPFSAPMTER
jgi:methylenetetrahydrofolate reductase (NADPH)